MLVKELLAALYGAPQYSRPNHLTNDADIAEHIAVKANPERSQLTIINNSVNTVYLHTDASVSANVGFVLQASASINFNCLYDGDLSTLEWHVAATANNSRITIYEVLFVSGGKHATV